MDKFRKYLSACFIFWGVWLFFFGMNTGGLVGIIVTVSVGTLLLLVIELLIGE